MEYESSLNQDLLLCLLLCHLSYRPWTEAMESIHIKRPFVNWLLLLDCTHPGHRFSLATQIVLQAGAVEGDL